VPAAAIGLIKEFEGCARLDPATGSLHAYPDPLTQAAPWTIGWGTTVYADGRPVGCHDTISQAEADSLLATTVQHSCWDPLSCSIPHWEAMNEPMRSALCSFAYNLGPGFFGSSGFNTITACLRDKRWEDVPAALLLYVNPGSPVEAGLRRRRQAEGRLWQEGLAHLGKQEQQPDTQILEAIRPTVLKKENRDSTALTPQQQVAVEQGCQWTIEALLHQEGDSRQVRLAYGASDLDVAGCIHEAAERTISHLNYAPIETGRYTCVFSPEAFLDLIGAFSGLFNARAVLDGVSLSNRDSIGETLAVPFLDIHDNGLHPGNIGASAFDGEGTPTKRLALLEGGVLRNFLHSEATARAFGVSPTGHAGMGAKVSVGPDWFEIGTTPGSNGGQAGLDRFKAGEAIVWIDSLSALHAGVKASQGSFSLPFDGWLIQNGEPRSIEAATVAGDIRQVLKAIVGFEGEAKVTPDGLCPMVWVEGLSITGEA
jgi:GH24 family phage-related lysozyme (muramidase)